jgi:starch phosphorylase
LKETIMAKRTSTPTTTVQESVAEDIRTGCSPEVLVRSFHDNLYYLQGRYPAIATLNDFYQAAAYTVRDRLLRRWIETLQAVVETDRKVVCYFSAEFLMGPQLGNNLLNLGIFREAEQGLETIGLKLEDLPEVRRVLEQRGEAAADFTLCLEHLLEEEEEPGLGNGGLGRLAACFMDSLASLEVPAVGYGIRYEFGIFDQAIHDGWQVEITDEWLKNGNPWEIARPEMAVSVGFGGHTESYEDERGRFRVRWIPDLVVEGVPYDTPISGYRVDTCNTLRLWSARAARSFDFQAFNTGDYYTAVEEKVASENLTKVLYPNDEFLGGKELRLKQQYFFVSCALQDLIRIHLAIGGDLARFHERFAAQLNDTHPAIAVAELMRLLVDEYGMEWDEAFDITRRTFAYTNHTLLPEALEKWPLPLFQRVLPRHLEIIYEINARFLDKVRLRYPGDEARIARMSLIDESGERYVRMAQLACVGSHAVNGVAELHSELLKSGILRDFYELEPESFHNVTNGVTPRRFIALINPRLAGLLDETIGTGWLADMTKLRGLAPHAEDAGFRNLWRRIKVQNKTALADYIRRKTGIRVDPLSLFDVQVKRIHEYKRQHLNALHIVDRYLRLKRNPGLDLPPRTFVFGGKAAPSYFLAKLVIKLITSIAGVVNQDPDIDGRIKVVFLPDYNVKNSRWVYPSADLSEQISTAGKEASGTGNMKFTMNGALTIGTLDGANIEIREEVGKENFFLFGLTAEEVERVWREGYRPGDILESNPELSEVLGLIASGHFSGGDREIFRPLVDNLRRHDPFLVLADFAGYVACQNQVDVTWNDSDRWTQLSILNTAGSGKFSSDRAILDYCGKIWNVEPSNTWPIHRN